MKFNSLLTIHRLQITFCILFLPFSCISQNGRFDSLGFYNHLVSDKLVPEQIVFNENWVLEHRINTALADSTYLNNSILYYKLNQRDSSFRNLLRISPAAHFTGNTEQHYLSMMILHHEINDSVKEFVLSLRMPNLKEEYQKAPHHSPVLAGLFSAVVPGAGKLYMGYKFQALSAFIMNMMLAGQSAESYFRTGPRSARFIVSASLFGIFYGGNIYGSIIGAKKQRHDYLKQIDHEIMVNSEEKVYGGVVSTAVPPPNIPKPVADSEFHTEYCYWQAKSDSSKFNALLLKAQIYRNSALYRQAIAETDRADTYAKKNEEQTQLKYEKMINSFLLDDYGYCSSIVFDSSEVIYHPKEIEYMALNSLNESGNWTRCKSELIKYVSRGDSNMKKEIMALPESYKYKSPEKSRHLSAILPGLGEIYAGYPVKGITSFFLNAGFIAFAGYNFYVHYYVTACVSGIFPMLKFYGGGKRLSTNLAERHNVHESNKIKKQYRDEIQTIMK